MTARLSLLLALLLSGCPTSELPDDDLSDDDDTADDDWRTAAACGPDGVAVTPDGLGFAVTTDEYSLYAEVSEVEAEALGAMLATAYDLFAAYFGAAAAPTLRIELYADEAAWGAAIEADGLEPPWGAGGVYMSSTQVAYLYVQPTRYFTRMLTLHEAAHQFHFLSRPAAGGVPGWYAEGVAEFLQRHHWDGDCLALGVVPLLTQGDSPEAALTWTDTNGFPLGDILDGVATEGRPVQQALFQFFETEHPADWRTFRDAMDSGGADARVEFETVFGPADDYEASMLDHIVDDQQPMSPVFMEWSHRHPASVEAWSEYFTVARLKEPPARLQATFAAPAEAFSGGLLLGWDSYDDWLALVVSADGHLWTFDVQDGAATWWDQGAAPPPSADGGYDFVLTHDPLSVGVNGQAWSGAMSVEPAGGLAINGTALRFEDIAWR